MAGNNYPPGSNVFPFAMPPWGSFNNYNWPPWSPDFVFPNPSSPSLLPSSPARSSSASSPGISRTSILTPAIVASVALLGSAILLISYYRVFAKYCSAWQLFWGLTSSDHRRDRGARNAIGASSSADLEQGWLLSMNTGLDESIVKRIPVRVFRIGEEGLVGSSECAVCLGEFEELEELRILPKCSHAFHLACIDVWLRCHSNCPLCRAPIAAVLALPAPPEEHGANLPSTNIPSENIAPPLQNMLPHSEVFALEIVESEAVDDSRRGERNAASIEQQEQGNLALKRSLSLQIDDDHPNYKRNRREFGGGPVVLRRSHSTGSNPLNYQGSTGTSSSSDSNGLVLLSSNLAAQIKTLGDEGEDDESDYVVLNIELASAASAGANYDQISGDKDSSIDASARKSGSFTASLKRSFSTGRVFSFRSFGRSRSHTSFST